MYNKTHTRSLIQGFSLLVAFAALVSVCHASSRFSPGDDLFHTSTNRLQKMFEAVDAMESRWLKHFTGKAVSRRNKRNRTYHTAESIQRGMESNRNMIRQHVEQIKRQHALLRKSKLSLREFSRSTHSSLRAVYGRLWAIHLTEVGWRVFILKDDHDVINRKMFEGVVKKQKEFDIRFADAPERRRAAIAALYTQKRQEESVRRQKTLEQYRELIDELHEHRALLAGEAWRWVDFSRKRELKDEEARWRKFVYGEFAYELSKRGPVFSQQVMGSKFPGDSTLDGFINVAGSKDRLILGVQLLPLNTRSLYKMNTAMRSVPVESLRQFDDTIPPAVVSGTDIEQTIRELEIRLTRFFLIQDALETKAEMQLKQAVAAAGRSSDLYPQFKSLSDNAASLAQRFRQHEQTSAEIEPLEQRIREADQRQDRISEVLKKSLEEFDKQKVRLEAGIDNYRAALKSIPVGSEAERKSKQRLTSLESDLVKLTNDYNQNKTRLEAESRNLSEQRRANMETLRKFRNELQSVDLSRSVESLEDQRFRLVGELREADIRLDVPQLPRVADEATLAAFAVATRDLSSNLTDLQRDHRFAIDDALERLQFLDREKILLAEDISRLRMLGRARADVALRNIGATDEDLLIQQLKTTAEILEESRKVVSLFKDRLSKVDKAVNILESLKFVDVKDRQKALVITGAVKDRIELLQSTIGRAATAVEVGLEIKGIEEDLNQNRPLAALAKYLDLVSKLGEKAPGIGRPLVEFLKFYSEATSASDKALRSIQRKLIQRELDIAERVATPDLYLYTEADVKRSFSVVNVSQDEVKRITTIFQVRRMIVLLRATTGRQAATEPASRRIK